MLKRGSLAISEKDFINIANDELYNRHIINPVCESYFDEAYKELPAYAKSRLNEAQLKEYGARRINHCQAWVWETPNYYVLQSYETFVAVIEKESCNTYDVLRREYGFTRTSAQHIAKFRKMYGKAESSIYTWR